MTCRSSYFVPIRQRNRAPQDNFTVTASRTLSCKNSSPSDHGRDLMVEQSTLCRACALATRNCRHLANRCQSKKITIGSVGHLQRPSQWRLPRSLQNNSWLIKPKEIRLNLYYVLVPVRGTKDQDRLFILPQSEMNKLFRNAGVAFFRRRA